MSDLLRMWEDESGLHVESFGIGNLSVVDKLAAIAALQEVLMHVTRVYLGEIAAHFGVQTPKSETKTGREVERCGE